MSGAIDRGSDTGGDKGGNGGGDSIVGDKGGSDGVSGVFEDDKGVLRLLALCSDERLSILSIATAETEATSKKQYLRCIESLSWNWDEKVSHY